MILFIRRRQRDGKRNEKRDEGGEPVFIETEYETWNMSPETLEQTFSFYLKVKLVVTAHLYGTPGRIGEI